MNYIVTIIMALMLSACGSIPEDNTPPPIDHNLYTVEMKACDNHRNVGQAGCVYNVNDDLENMFLEIPLFHKGEYQVRSKSCAFNENKKYDKKEKVTLSIAELIKRKPSSQFTCTFDVKIFIDEFDRGLRGIFTIVDLDGIKTAKAEFLGTSFDGIGYYQLRAGSSKDLSLEFDADYSGSIAWFGCEIESEKRFEDHPIIKLKEVIQTNLSSDDSCILEVGLIPDDTSLPVEKFTFNIQIYNKDVVNLPDPIIRYDDEELEIESGRVVAAMAINSKHEIYKGKGKRDLDADVARDKTVWVRLITANGRYKLLKVRNGRIIWNTLKL